MPRAAEARDWWADIENVRERIERRRARESRAYRESRARANGASTEPAPVDARRRGVREIRPGQRLMLVETAAPPARTRHRRPPRSHLAVGLGSHPDRIAAWAAILGFTLVAVALLSTHV